VQFPFINVQTKHDELNMLLHVLFGKHQRWGNWRWLLFPAVQC